MAKKNARTGIVKDATDIIKEYVKHLALTTQGKWGLLISQFWAPRGLVNLDEVRPH